MIHFIDLDRGMRGNHCSDESVNFAFYDDAVDRLIVVHNRCVFHSLADLIYAYVLDHTISGELGTRLLCLCPDRVRGIQQTRRSLKAVEIK